MKTPSTEVMRKVTVNLPAKLLTSVDGMGTTELIREALDEYQRVRKQRALLKMFGKVKFDLTYEKIKAER